MSADSNTESHHAAKAAHTESHLECKECPDCLEVTILGWVRDFSHDYGPQKEIWTRIKYGHSQELVFPARLVDLDDHQFVHWARYTDILPQKQVLYIPNSEFAAASEQGKLEVHVVEDVITPVSYLQIKDNRVCIGDCFTDSGPVHVKTFFDPAKSWVHVRSSIYSTGGRRPRFRKEISKIYEKTNFNLLEYVVCKSF